MKILELENDPLATLRQMAKDLNIPNAARLKKENLMIKIRQVEAEREGLEVRGGGNATRQIIDIRTLIRDLDQYADLTPDCFTYP
jgi:transcription termination factor Rho